jgi:phosphatidylserine/phosphatidylglycerophosphate/cardiolipin synthase-like enzyme
MHNDGTALLTASAQGGAEVRVLTNSLASSDERIVHAGDMKRRLDLLRAGVELYELKPTTNQSSLKIRGRFGAGKVAGLHAKTYAVDGDRIFVGSFNFDQRSARLNTEMGVVIDSPMGATELTEIFERDVPDVAYRVQLPPTARPWSGPSAMPTAARSATTWIRRPTGRSAWASARCRDCRSTGCCSGHCPASCVRSPAMRQRTSSPRDAVAPAHRAGVAKPPSGIDTWPHGAARAAGRRYSPRPCSNP